MSYGLKCFNEVYMLTIYIYIYICVCIYIPISLRLLKLNLLSYICRSRPSSDRWLYKNRRFTIHSQFFNVWLAFLDFFYIPLWSVIMISSSTMFFIMLSCRWKQVQRVNLETNVFIQCCSYWYWCPIVIYGRINLGQNWLNNVLLSGATKPSSMAYHQRVLWHSHESQFPRKYVWYQFVNEYEHY